MSVEINWLAVLDELLVGFTNGTGFAMALLFWYRVISPRANRAKQET